MDLMDIYRECDGFTLSDGEPPAENEQAAQLDAWDLYAASLAFPPSKPGAKFRAKQPGHVNVQAYLSALAKLLLETRRASARIHCEFEADDASYLSEDLCRMFGLALCELVTAVADVSDASRNDPIAIKVVLRRKASVLCCAMFTPLLADAAFSATTRIASIEQIGAVLGNSGIVRVIPERNVLAIMLDSNMAESRIPAAIVMYRSARQASRSSRERLYIKPLTHKRNPQDHERRSS